MPTITLKNIPDQLYLRIKATAHEHKRSMNREILFRLERSLESPRPDARKLLKEIDRIRGKFDGRVFLTDDLIREWKEHGRP